MTMGQDAKMFGEYEVMVEEGIQDLLLQEQKTGCSCEAAINVVRAAFEDALRVGIYNADLLLAKKGLSWAPYMGGAAIVDVGTETEVRALEDTAAIPDTEETTEPESERFN
jgi:hypothetical protein